MNVLEIVPHFGFANSFLKGRVGYFQKRGINMFLATSWDDNLPAFAEHESISYMYTAILRMPSPIKDFKAIWKICRYIRHSQIDCVVGHADKGKLLACICGKLTGRKVMLFAHGTSFEGKHGIVRKLFVLLDKFESSIAQKVICVSPYLVQLRLLEGIDKEGKAYLPNKGSCAGVDCFGKFNPDNIGESEKIQLKESLGIKRHDFVIGFCGRLVREKGVEELVSAFEIIKTQYNVPAKLLLVGQSDIRDFASADILDVIDHDSDIIKVGHVDNTQVYYSIMNLFVLPTHRDGLGMCLLEAASMRVPVMTTNFTGSRDAMVHGLNGEYIELSPEDIAVKVNGLYEVPEKLQEYGLNGREWICANFENKLVWNSILECYETVLCRN